MTTSLFTASWTVLASGGGPMDPVLEVLLRNFHALLIALASFVTIVYGLLHIFAGGEQVLSYHLTEDDLRPWA